ncbi:putative respiratory complex assembly protein Rmp1 [Aspergillus clavatus NRRL 1]|uniref:Mitochondrial inner-membrane-bound regulator-domain-containing protein n=1 Tax=Aspergillus clavatus (strain ATCC 1007 / CBS 513.65 / DSM 816 / NCTC 3887 / NRRL 1 / QM 1276 / 107) TaxID=344612 RepID=A1CRA1_ASPCL|nr:uncharacterized protein ACLA_028980 [Aspergillus clavatus NRRL 1]EAW08172.1 conserved hypothetical protein [Aspergillus clavatus NRRL 1]
MLSRFAGRTAGRRLGCHYNSPCRESLLSLTGYQRDASIRFQSTEPDSTDKQASRPRYRRKLRDHAKKQPESRRVTLDVDSLGKPGEIVVLPHRDRRRRISKVKNTSSDTSSLPFMLEDVEYDEVIPSSAAILERIQSFCEPHRPRDKLNLTDWDDLRTKLQLSFTFQQLTDYIQSAKAQNEEGVTHQGKHIAVWRPGTSAFLETGPVSQGGVADRVAVAQALKGKQLVAERILRDCWQLGVAGELGQLDIRLPAHSLSLLLQSEHFSFEELASLHDAKIDITRSLGLVRITGNQHACESICEIIYDATNRIRQEEIDLYTLERAKSKGERVFSPEFLSWVGNTYGVAFEGPPQAPTKIFYLAENRENADNARRTLNLAIYSLTSPAIPFGTYLSASQVASVYNVDPEQNVSWFDRQHAWFRWAMSSTQTSETKVLDTPFYDKHQSRLSDELLNVLRKKSPSIAESTGIRESITAAVGRCLFMRSPSSEAQTVSASQLGRMSLPRTFTTDVPRVTSFLRMLTAQAPGDDQRLHLFRLIPTAANANSFPRLEMEVAVKKTPDISNSEVEVIVRGMRAEVAESSVDYLLPENGLDLRFTRKLYRDLLGTSGENESVAEATVESIRACLQDVFLKRMRSEGESPLPAFTRVPVPDGLLTLNKPSVTITSQEQDSSSGYTTAEYMFLPVNDIRGTRIHRYDFQGQQLNYSFYESGPFNPYRTTDISLSMDATEIGGSSTAAKESGSQDPLHLEFNGFYGAACSLAFELDKAWRMDVV